MDGIGQWRALLFGRQYFFNEHIAHNGFEISLVFPDSCPRLLSKYFSEDVWNYVLEGRNQGKPFCQQMKDLDEDIVMVAETGASSFDGNVVMLPCNEFLPTLAYVRKIFIFTDTGLIAIG